VLVVLCGAILPLSALAQQDPPPTQDAFFEIIHTQGAVAATETFRRAKQAAPDTVLFAELALNRVGYEYLGRGEVDEAIEIFRLNVEAYPDAFNTYDSLGEAYMVKGEIALAVANYEKSVELNPENDVGRRYAFLLRNYTKQEYRIPMRDGVTLFTQVYAPRDGSRTYPILMIRSPYGMRRYGSTNYRNTIGPNELCVQDGYIFVWQDVRGRYMSEGEYVNVRPHVRGDDAIDESSDTYDTIEWLLANVENHNGKVGMWGISYPGFYTSAALPEAHPALVAASPQAPIADWFFDDFRHHGALMLNYFRFERVIGFRRDTLTTRPWWSDPPLHTRDGYKFFMDLGPLRNAANYFGERDFFWQHLVEHPNYDAFWQARNILPHLKGLQGTAVMTVGGWYDAEDLYGTFNTYRALERQNPGIFNIMVIGPWRHGGWTYDRSPHMFGDIYFGDNISGWYQRAVEAPFFRHFLKGEGEAPDYEALTFDTGRHEWREFQTWPPVEAETLRFHFRAEEGLTTQPPTADEAAYTEYVSDPNEPVPARNAIRFARMPRAYMNEDQRMAERRPDVIAFQTEILEEDLTLVGDMVAHLQVSTTGTAADWVVKLIDVFPDDEPNGEHTPRGVRMSSYQLMVRSEVIRGRFRNSYEHPEPFVPGEVTTVTLPLQDVLHTFKKGHRVMVQVQSTWFPLVDRNPQRYLDNIFLADEADFIKATHRVYHSPARDSYLEVRTLP
jgi:putative CocE/NonD family hydrolase